MQMRSNSDQNWSICLMTFQQLVNCPSLHTCANLDFCSFKSIYITFITVSSQESVIKMMDSYPSDLDLIPTQTYSSHCWHQEQHTANTAPTLQKNSYIRCGHVWTLESKAHEDNRIFNNARIYFVYSRLC